jgi:hypothetical protein
VTGPVYLVLDDFGELGSAYQGEADTAKAEYDITEVVSSLARQVRDPVPNLSVKNGGDGGSGLFDQGKLRAGPQSLRRLP